MAYVEANHLSASAEGMDFLRPIWPRENISSFSLISVEERMW